MMELKKNPKKDLTRNSGMYFVVGLTMVLMLTYVALEWKSFYGNEFYDVSENIDIDIEEEAPIFTLETPPPPPPEPIAPDKIEVVDDEDPIEEDDDTEFMLDFMDDGETPKDL